MTEDETQKGNILDITINDLFRNTEISKNHNWKESSYLSEQRPKEGYVIYAWNELQLDGMITSIGNLTNSETTILNLLISGDHTNAVGIVKEAVKEVNIENQELGDRLVELCQNVRVPKVYTFFDEIKNREITSLKTSEMNNILKTTDTDRFSERSWEEFVQNYVSFYEAAQEIVSELQKSSSGLLNEIGDYTKFCLEDERIKGSYDLAKEQGEDREIDPETVTLETRFIENKKLMVNSGHIDHRNIRPIKLPGYEIILRAKDKNEKSIEKEVGFIDGRNDVEIMKLRDEMGGNHWEEIIPCQSHIESLPAVLKPDYEGIAALLLDGATNPDVKKGRTSETSNAVEGFKQLNGKLDKMSYVFGLLQHVVSSVTYKQALQKHELPFCIAEENGESRHPVQIQEGYAPIMVSEKVNSGKEAVANDFVFEGDERIALSAGANGAGKTTYLITTGQNYILANAGWVNCANSVVYNPNGKIYTLFADRPKSIEGRKSRHIGHGHDVRYILVNAKEGDLALIDEFFTGTEEVAASELGGKVIDYMMDEISTDACIATHIHKLQRDYSSDTRVRNLKAVISDENGTIIPTYKIKQGIAGKSYGVETVRNILDMDKITQERHENDKR
jgi:hypothetical protein